MLVISRIIWFASAVLPAWILFRELRTKTLATYSYFSVYIFSSCAATILLYLVWIKRPDAYPKCYWSALFVTLMIGCGIVLEIFRHVLRPYPGAEKFATAVGLVTFGAVFAIALLYRLLALGWSPSGTSVELERDVRTVQAIFLFGIFAVIFYYGIPIGKNLKGMTTGYGLYILTSLVTLAVRSYAGPQFNNVWNIVQPLAYDASLLVWLVSMWSYRPNPVPDAPIHLEEDYEALAARTKHALGTMRSRLAKAGRT
ncbi:MAG: hypothetical protein ABR973_02485 [Candidatus Acidiferrales bacterium]|jgi:hypothetical protein